MYALIMLAAGTAAVQLPLDPQCPPPPIVLVCPPPPCVSAAPPSSSPIRHIAAKPGATPVDEVIRWNEATLDAIRAEKTTPPQAARNLAMVHAAVYDAVNIVNPTHEPYAVRGTTPPGTSVEAAAAVAAHRVLIALYPKRTEAFYRVLDESMAGVPQNQGRADGITLGRLVGERVLEWRSKDVEASTSRYTPDAGVGRWKPTPPNYTAALLPQWQTLPCFAMRNGSQFRAKDPPRMDSEEFVRSFNQVKALGAADSKVRTADQTEIAHFWVDGPGTATPPGHWNQIAQMAALRRRYSLAENARLFAMLNVALADASVACWDCKYHFDFWRPVTAIREADRLKNPAVVADPKWLPLIETPPFPSYTSGHSTFSAAGAAVLTAEFGDHFRFTSTSDGLPGANRSYESFGAAAKEAGISRIYGGIHWDFDNREGLASGTALGRYVAENFFRPRPTAGVRVSAIQPVEDRDTLTRR